MFSIFNDEFLLLPCTLFRDWPKKNTSHGQKEQFFNVFVCFCSASTPGSYPAVHQIRVESLDQGAWHFFLPHRIHSVWWRMKFQIPETYASVEIILANLIHPYVLKGAGLPIQFSTNYHSMTIWGFNMFHMSSFTTSDLSFSPVGEIYIETLSQINSKTNSVKLPKSTSG